MNPFSEVEAELAQWHGAGLTPSFWLRDDDAVAPSAALERLITLVRRHEVPLLLAVIPAGATAALAARLAGEPLVTPAVHGHAHRRQSADGVPPLELGGERPAEAVLAELAAGRDRLLSLFGDRLSGILVPPWNRIAPEVAARVHEVGFTAVSTNSWHVTGTRLPELNTQIDIVDWAEGRRGRSLAWTAGELLRRLKQARARGGAPLGILSHHLVHDEQAWETLEGLIRYLKVERGFAFGRADGLVAFPSPRWRGEGG